MEIVEAVVGEGGVLHVPFPEGTPVKVQAKKFAEYTREEWVAFVNDFAGSITDLERPEPSPSREVESLAD